MFDPKSKLLKTLVHNWHFPQFWPKINVFHNLEQKTPLSTSLSQKQYFRHFDPKLASSIFYNLNRKSTFSTVLPKTDTFHSFDPKSIFSAILIQAQYFSKFWLRIEIFHKFYQKSIFPNDFDWKSIFSAILTQN